MLMQHRYVFNVFAMKGAVRVLNKKRKHLFTQLDGRGSRKYLSKY